MILVLPPKINMDVQESKWIHNLLNGSMDKICFHFPRVITFLVCFFKSPLPIKVKIAQNMHVNYPGNKTKKTLNTTKSVKDPQVMPCCLNAQNLKFPKQPLSLSYGYPQMPCKKKLAGDFSHLCPLEHHVSW